ncbi:MAG: FecR domain-containing protein [Pseudomonadota bacterium]|nr:FecR domain-containing protein [Pseudomonadota bacterium]
MFRSLVAAFLSLCLAGLTLPALADSGSWTLVESDGVVRVMVPGSAIAKARPGMDLPTGTLVTTGKDATATLERDAQRIGIAPESRLTLSASSGEMTLIRQDAGAAAYEVDRRKAKHFRVDTALIAAVVKGTVFTVSAGPDADSVHVSNGLVEVRAQADGRAVDVNPGEIASVARNAPDRIDVSGPKEASTPLQAPDVPAIDYAEASDQLLKPFDGADRDEDGGARPASAGPEADFGDDGEGDAIVTAANDVALAIRNPSLGGQGDGNDDGNGNGLGNGNGVGGGDDDNDEDGNGNGNGNGNGQGDDNGNGNGVGGNNDDDDDDDGNGNGNGNGQGDDNGNGNGVGGGDDDDDDDDNGNGFGVGIGLNLGGDGDDDGDDDNDDNGNGIGIGLNLGGDGGDDDDEDDDDDDDDDNGNGIGIGLNLGGDGDDDDDDDDD